ncbi:hypothetical protein [Sediminicurvatus halobius]|uniref:Uncharacterized protein n=1 Tax=Sediminicurvatus halobius TaxID=2182432 RepID=A0A2U2MYE2_9GAMM|nr:hypothetical protein [Spiribacter halobius]PWG61828.1 hypothetical protein DEM34_14565 [Spiribacter halobius]UEX77670.1 hypothetical protein LMH63_17335 [Spiribacter halobius]
MEHIQTTSDYAADSNAGPQLIGRIKAAVAYPFEMLRLYRVFLRGRRELLSLTARERWDAGLSPEVIIRHTSSFRQWVRETQPDKDRR